MGPQILGTLGGGGAIWGPRVLLFFFYIFFFSILSPPPFIFVCWGLKKKYPYCGGPGRLILKKELNLTADFYCGNLGGKKILLKIGQLFFTIFL